MDKKIAGLLGAAAALTTVGGAHATSSRTDELPTATRYSDLLDPIPNALVLLKADDARLAERAARKTEVAQYGPPPSSYSHHHHHHHHSNYLPPVVRQFIPGPQYHHHHHHHHHHHSQYYAPPYYGR
jgi:hypothetical protein